MKNYYKLVRNKRVS